MVTLLKRGCWMRHPASLREPTTYSKRGSPYLLCALYQASLAAGRNPNAFTCKNSPKVNTITHVSALLFVNYVISFLPLSRETPFFETRTI